MQKIKPFLFRNSIFFIALIVIGGAVLVRAQSVDPLFIGPQASAPNNGSLNDLTDLDQFIQTGKVSKQEIQSQLVVGNSTDAVAYIGELSGFSIENSEGSGAYGYADSETNTIGAYGYAEGNNSVGVVGRTGTNSTSAFAGAFSGKLGLRGDAGGQLDSIFSGDGSETVTDAKRFNSIVSDRNALYIGGIDDSNNWYIQKRNLNVDTAPLFTTFGGGTGYVLSVLSGTDNQLSALVIDDGHLYVVGWEEQGVGQRQWRIEKRNKFTGALCDSVSACADGAFHGDGIATANYGANIDFSGAYSTVLSADEQYLYTAGFERQAPTFGIEWVIEKRRADNGSVCDGTAGCDSPFGVNGTISGVAQSNNAYKIVLDDEYLYVVGDAGPSGNQNWRIGKFRQDTGALCTDNVVCNEMFGVSGYIVGTAGHKQPHDAYVDSAAGRLYVVGNNDSPTDWRIEKYRTDTGATCTGGVCPEGNFGDSGSGVIIQAAGGDEGYGIAVSDEHFFVAAEDAITGWRIEKRDLISGDLDTSFGSLGVVRSEGVSTIPYDIVYDGAHIYIVGSETLGSDGRIERRFSDTNSANLMVENTAWLPNILAMSSLYTSPAFTSLNGIRVQGVFNEPALNGLVETGDGRGIYVYSQNLYGALVTASESDTGSVATVEGSRGRVFNSDLAGVWGESDFGNGVGVYSESPTSTAWGVSSDTTNGAGVYAAGGEYSAFFEGEFFIDGGNEMYFGDVPLSENDWIDLINWCGVDCQ